MDRHQRARPLRSSVITLALTAFLGTLLGGPAQAVALAAPAELLPDLRMGRPYDLHIRTNRAGAKRLRFGTIAWNRGAGPLEVNGYDRADSMGTISQRIYNSDGSWRDVIPPTGRMFYSGDGHDHWHVDQLVLMELYRKSNPTNVRRIRKIGYCLYDTHRHAKAPANATPDYRWCGDKTSETVRMGISAGYGDDYRSTVKYQFIDITGLPRGEYRLCATVNPRGDWIEQRVDNNYYWIDLKLDASAGKFSIIARGQSTCHPSASG